MLRKLLKYESKAVVRLLLPLHLALIGVSILGHFYVKLAMERMSDRFFFMHLSLAFLYVLALFAVIVLTYVYLYILRPRQNWFSDEGYLTHTLPVTSAQHIWSKLLTTMFWVFVNSFCIILSVLLVSQDLMTEVFGSYGILSTYEPVSFLDTVEVILNSLLSSALSILLVYMCMSIGYSFNQCKLLISAAIYIGISVVANLFSTLLVIFVAFGNEDTYYDLVSIMDTRLFTWLSLLATLLLAVGAFLITRHFLSKRLNLE